MHCADIRVRVANPDSKSLVQINSDLLRGEIGVCRRAVCLLGRIAPLGTQREPCWCCLIASAGTTTRMGHSGCTAPVPNQDNPQDGVYCHKPTDGATLPCKLTASQRLRGSVLQWVLHTQPFPLSTRSSVGLCPISHCRCHAVMFRLGTAVCLQPWGKVARGRVQMQQITPCTQCVSPTQTPG